MAKKYHTGATSESTFDNAGFQQVRYHEIYTSYQDARRRSDLKRMLKEDQNLYDEIFHAMTQEEEEMVQKLLDKAAKFVDWPKKYKNKAHEYIDRAHKLMRQIADNRGLLSRHPKDLKGLTGGKKQRRKPGEEEAKDDKRD